MSFSRRKDFQIYYKLRQDEALQLDNMLKISIANYKLKNYNSIEVKDKLKTILNDWANKDLIDKIDSVASAFKVCLREIIEEIYERVQTIQGKEGSVNQKLNSFYDDLQKEHQGYIDDHQKLESDNPFDYLVYHDPFWKQAVRDIVQQQYDQEQEMIKTQNVVLKVLVTFQSENVRQEYQDICKLFLDDLKKVEKKLDSTLENTLKIIFACFIKFRHTNAQKLFFSESDRLSLNKFEPIVKSDDVSLVTFNNPYKLLPQGLDIKLEKQKDVSDEVLLNCIDQLLNDGKYCFISINEELLNEPNPLQIHNDESQLRKLQNFFTYFYYSKTFKKEEQRLQYAFVPEKVLLEGQKKMEQDCFGLEGFLKNDQMTILHEDFKNPLTFYGCRGPLIYGPPGTGKTYIIQRMINFYEIHLVFDGNSSTFQGSLVGQGSRLLQIYFNRAKAIPWQPCAAHIGEIEQLVKKKDKDGGGGGSAEVLNKLLELMDGTETVGNVKVFSTTNHVEMIEEAILSRFRQIYLGKSNSSLRRDWIVWYLMNIKKQGGYQAEQFNEIMKGFFSQRNSEYNEFMQKTNEQQKFILRDRIKDIVDYSINFSTRQLKDLVSNYTSKITFKEITFDSTSKDKLDIILKFCKTLGSENFLFGNQILPELMFKTTLQNSSEFTDELKQNFIRLASNDNLPQQNSRSQNDDNYELSRIILLDLSTDSRQRINILKQKEITTEKMNQKESLKNKYHTLNLLLLSEYKLESLVESTYKYPWSLQDKEIKLNTLIPIEKRYIIKDLNSLTSTIKFLESTDIKNLQDKNIQELLYSYKTQQEDRLKISQYLKEEMQNISKGIQFQNISQELAEIERLLNIGDGVNSIKCKEQYLALIKSEISKSTINLKGEINLNLLSEFNVEQIVNQDKFYKLDYCTLQETNYDYILLLLSHFIKNGDFSKVDMVDYHSCEKNNARDVNSFKSYISNITKEAIEEEKSLIVYKLDEILDVAHQEDAELEKEQREMGKKIFQSINLDNSKSNQWNIFITKNQNVIDLFYNTVSYWPRESQRGQEITQQQEQLKLRQCKICRNKFKFAEDDDQCKAHTSDEFFMNRNMDIYKKFEDNWYSTYLQEYDKRKDHKRNHQGKVEYKGCNYCENKQRFNQNFDKDIFELNKKSFDEMKSCDIIPNYFKTFEQIELYKQPLGIDVIKQKISKREIFISDVKRVCCDANFTKEECNPHKHVEDIQDQMNEQIKVKINERIKDLLLNPQQ